MKFSGFRGQENLHYILIQRQYHYCSQDDVRATYHCILSYFVYF